jgi:hypothetical protein
MNRTIHGKALVILFYGTLLFSTLLILHLSGCATIKYNYGGKTFPSSDEALVKQRADLSKILEAIKPTTAPVHGKAIIITPTREELRQHYIRITGNPAHLEQEQIEYICSLLENDQNMLAKAIQKKELFDQVTMINLPDPAAASIGGNDFLIYRDIDSWFIKGQKTSPKKILMDASSASGLSRTNSFLEFLEERAHNMVK